MKINQLHIIIGLLAFLCVYLFFSRKDKIGSMNKLEQTYLQEIADIRADREAGYRVIDSLEKINTVLMARREVIKKEYTTKKQPLDDKRKYYTNLPADAIDARLLFFAKELATEDSVPQW